MPKAAFVRQISADYAGLVALFARKLGDRALAEDLINQAYVESLEKLAGNRIADPGRFSGFVYRVAFNLLRNHRRRMDNRTDARASATTLENLACDAAYVERLFREDVAEQVRSVVAQLPVARDREVVRRFYLEEQHKTTICRDLGLSPINFDKIVFRARRRLKELFQSSGVQHGELMSAAGTEWCIADGLAAIDP